MADNILSNLEVSNLISMFGLQIKYDKWNEAGWIRASMHSETVSVIIWRADGEHKNLMALREYLIDVGKARKVAEFKEALHISK